MSLSSTLSRCLGKKCFRRELDRVSRLNPKGRRLQLEPLEDRRMLSVTLFVDDDSTAATPDGLGWDTAYADFQAALTQAATLNADTDPANDVTQIWVAEGTYRPVAGVSTGAPSIADDVGFTLLDGVSLYGGFAGTEASLAERPVDITLHETIFSGDLGVLGDTSDNADMLFYCGEETETTLDRITITAGTGAGGINNAGTLSLMDSKVIGNSSPYGGGILNVGIMDVTNSTKGGSRLAPPLVRWGHEGP